ncbi:hypothetical protein DFO73_11396 [Cytobacillus oceanisediminis]|jgi:hypothetical protein|uniref:GK1464-like domain-containing protein n=1 Tax=Cytobacillus oceanisediminis TaxID=665099 RepID=A0A2V2ZMG6_9BACI|nr:DUF5634 family protein [Cytobacillus oceanisediminis]PWW25497.1 hypothetical protein DFO73_11396 [Cytobacillus oceanisediminis]
MDFLPREQIINALQEPLQSYISKYGIDDIGIFEEEGQDNQYYMGYTVKKEGKTYHIHSPYTKNDNGGLAPIKKEWTVETDEPQKDDRRGFNDLDQAFRVI